MRTLFSVGLLWLITIVSCTAADKPSEVPKGDSNSQCDTIVQYASERICLPTVDGWKEGLRHPRMQGRRGIFEDTLNTTFGVYVSNKSWALDDIDNTFIDDYFKVYAPIQGSQFKISANQLPQMNNTFTGSALRGNWKSIESNWEGMYPEFELGYPVLFETYETVGKHFVTNVYLMRVEFDGAEQFILMTVSLCVIKERILFVAHYLTYNNRSSVSTAKSKSDYFMLRLVEENS